MNEDYPFRYRLEPRKAGEEKVYSDPLLELIRSQLEQLLDLVVLTYKGEDVKVDGFKPLNDPDKSYDIFHQSEDPPGEP
jgi:dihydropteroate synthase